MDETRDDQKMSGELVAVLTITELIAKYGVPVALQLIANWNIKDPTPADWEALKLKSAETYFPPKGTVA